MERHIRKEHRLKNYDYSRNGAYFITICTLNRKFLFWQDHDIHGVGAASGGPPKKIKLTEYGAIVRDELKKIPAIYPDAIFVSKFVIMPNHIHMLIVINNFPKSGDLPYGPPKAAPTIGRIINKFKGAVTKRSGFPIWQRSFYDRIIRNDKEFADVWQYIENNPVNWQNDEYYVG